jgi:hypothetical protein
LNTAERERANRKSFGRKMHNEKLRRLHSSANIITVIKSENMRWVGSVARMMAKRNTYRILIENPKKIGRLKDLDIDGIIILKWILHR